MNQQPATNNQQPRFKCRHIFTDGRRCASPSLRQEHFCYFHHTTRKPITPEIQKERRRTTARLNEFHLPLPEDRSAIQSSIGIILQKIASNDLDPRRAGLLLYALQIASLNLPKQKEEEAEELVQEFTTDPEYGTLAPQTEIHEKKSSIALLLEELTRPQPKPAPAVLPLIQACEQPRVTNQQQATNNHQLALRWRLQPKLRHHHLQVLPRLTLHPRIPQQERRMISHRQLRPTAAMPPARAARPATASPPADTSQPSTPVPPPPAAAPHPSAAPETANTYSPPPAPEHDSPAAGTSRCSQYRPLRASAPSR